MQNKPIFLEPARAALHSDLGDLPPEKKTTKPTIPRKSNEAINERNRERNFSLQKQLNDLQHASRLKLKEDQLSKRKNENEQWRQQKQLKNLASTLARTEAQRMQLKLDNKVLVADLKEMEDKKTTVTVRTVYEIIEVPADSTEQKSTIEVDHAISGSRKTKNTATKKSQAAYKKLKRQKKRHAKANSSAPSSMRGHRVTGLLDLLPVTYDMT